MTSDMPHGRILWVGYALATTAVFATINALTPYEPGIPNELNVILVVLLVLLYSPLFYLPRFQHWHLRDFGLKLNPLSLALVVLFGALCSSSLGYKDGFVLVDGFVEAVLRSGEEILYRGFVYSVVLGLSARRKHAWVWATVLSALLFTLAHSSAFRQEYLLTGGATPPWLFVTERLLNVLLLAIGLGLIRAGTGSIVPAMVIHSIAGGGIIALPGVMAISGLIYLWSLARREPFWSFSVSPAEVANPSPHP